MEKTSLTAKLLGRAALNLRYYVNRVLGNAVAASNHFVGIEFFVETTSASVFFLVFFLALRTDRVKEGTVMVISWTQTLLRGFLWLWIMVAVTWLIAMSVRLELHSGRAPATRREGELGRTRRRRWQGMTSGVANTCAEDEKQPWVNGEKKFINHGARWLGSHARQWQCARWSGRGKPREKIQESEALQKTTLQTSCSTSSERKCHPHVFGIPWTAMNLTEIDLCSMLDFQHRCLEHIIWILAVACCFFVSKAFNHVLLKLWTSMPAWISLIALIQGGTVLCFTTGNKWTGRYGWTPSNCPLFESYTSMLSNRA